MYDKKTLIVGIGDYKVINNTNIILKTIALGSCVAIIFFCFNTNIIGMAHIALPSSSINPVKALTMPAYFADTGLNVLLKEMRRFDSNGKITAKLVGGASILDKQNFFNIGNRNVFVIKQILQTLRIPILSEDVGGYISRTVTINNETKKVIISHKEKIWEI
ncbi:MAG: chemotaxis protein CheD [Cyanobacteriota bacterium]